MALSSSSSSPSRASTSSDTSSSDRQLALRDAVLLNTFSRASESPVELSNATSSTTSAKSSADRDIFAIAFFSSPDFDPPTESIDQRNPDTIPAQTSPFPPSSSSSLKSSSTPSAFPISSTSLPLQSPSHALSPDLTQAAVNSTLPIKHTSDMTLDNTSLGSTLKLPPAGSGRSSAINLPSPSCSTASSSHTPDIMTNHLVSTSQNDSIMVPTPRPSSSWPISLPDNAPTNVLPRENILSKPVLESAVSEGSSFPNRIKCQLNSESSPRSVRSKSKLTANDTRFRNNFGRFISLLNCCSITRENLMVKPSLEKINARESDTNRFSELFMQDYCILERFFLRKHPQKFHSASNHLFKEKSRSSYSKLLSSRGKFYGVKQLRSYFPCFGPPKGEKTTKQETVNVVPSQLATYPADQKPDTLEDNANRNKSRKISKLSHETALPKLPHPLSMRTIQQDEDLLIADRTLPQQQLDEDIELTDTGPSVPLSQYDIPLVNGTDSDDEASSSISYENGSVVACRQDGLTLSLSHSSTLSSKQVSLPLSSSLTSSGLGIEPEFFAGLMGPPRYLLPPIRPELRGRKCLILDLDETLVHSSFKILNHSDFTIPVEIEGRFHNVYVIKRPGVDEFMKRVGELFEIVVFTASVSKYGNPLLDQLDVHGVVHHRLFRESCYNHHGNYVKDLSQVGRDLKDTIIIDNSPTSYILHPQHALPISSWFFDAHDNELLDLIPVLEDLASSRVSDVSLVLDVSL